MELKNFFAQDLQGNVIPSPTVYLYEPGTTTPVTGLQDATGGALTNPFVGTTNGQVVVSAPDGDYDMRVIGAGRNTTMRVRFIDTVTNSASVLRFDLAASSGASLVGSIAEGVGAISTDVQSELRERVSIFSYLSAAERLDVLLPSPVLDHTLSIRKAIASCAEGGKVYGNSKHTYNINLQTDGYCVLIEKGITVDLNGASVIYKPWKTGFAATVHSPAFFFRGSKGTAKTVNAVSGRPMSVTLSTVGDSSSFAAGDYVLLTSTAAKNAWDYPIGGTYGGYGELQQIAGVNAGTGVVTFSRILEGDYSATASISRLNLLNSPKLLNVKSAVEIDSGVISTKPLTEDCGHFASFYCCNQPIADSWKVSAFRMFVCMSWLNVKPETTHIQGTNPPAMYPPQGGHAYVIRHHLCLGGYSAHNLGVKTRHLIDYTSSHGCVQENNVDFGAQTAFLTHGFGERRIISKNDCSYGPLSAGWSFGNNSFGPSFEGKIENFTVQTSVGHGIIFCSESNGLEVISPNIKSAGSSEICVTAISGAANLTITGGEISMAGNTTNRPCINASAEGALIQSGIASITATAGTSEVVTVVTSLPHGLVAGESIHMGIRSLNTAVNPYAGTQTVATTPNSTTFTYVQAGTTSESMSTSTTTWCIWKLAGYKPVSNVTVDGVSLFGGVSSSNVMRLSVEGTLITKNNSISPANASGTCILLDDFGCSKPSVNIKIEDNLFIGTHYASVAGAQCASAMFRLYGNKSTAFTGAFYYSYGTTAQNIARLTLNGSVFQLLDNVCNTPVSALGIVNTNLWEVVRLGGLVRGNSYPKNATSMGSYNRNWEFGTFTPTLVGGTTAGTVTMSLVTNGKYALSGKVLHVHTRVTWSAFTGTGQMKIQGMPYSVNASGMPVSVSEASLAFTGQLCPSMFGYEIRLRQLNGGVSADVPVSATGDLLLFANVLLES